MPFYEFGCQECGRVEERMFSMGTVPDEIRSTGCEAENGDGCRLTRQISSVARPNVKGGTPTHHHRAPRK